MTTSELLDAGMTVALGFWGLGLLMVFIWGVFFGFVDFMRRMLG